MGLKEKIYSVNKEASLYNSQGMYEEALEKYEELVSLIKGFKNLKNGDDLISKINGKVKEINKRLDYYSKGNAVKDISHDKKEMIKKLFSESNSDPEFKNFQEALTLAKFGQFEEAIKDMAPFLRNKNLRVDAARNILKCYRALGRDSDADRLIGEWKTKEILTEQEALSLSGGEAEEPGSAREEDINELQLEVPADQESPEIMEINSVGIKLTDKDNSDSDPVELDVSFQTGNHLSLIISSKEKGIINNLDVGVKLNEMSFYSPIAVFKSSGIVLSKHQIKSGPKKGDWCLDIEIKNPT